MLNLNFYLFIVLLIIFYSLLKKKNKIEKFTNQKNITYITALFIVENNKKNNLEHYKKYLIKTLNLLKNKYIIFYYNDEYILDYIPNKYKNKNIIFIKKEIKDLYTYKYSNAYLNSCKNQNNKKLESYNNKNEKGLVHYKREYIHGGEEVYKNLFTIWTSKLFLIKDTIKDNPFKTDNFAWCDISITRTKYYKKILDLNIKPNKIYNFSYSTMKYNNKNINIQGGFLLGNKIAFLNLINLFKNKIISLKNSNYAHDEETILTLISYENKNFFISIR